MKRQRWDTHHRYWGFPVAPAHHREWSDPKRRRWEPPHGRHVTDPVRWVTRYRMRHQRRHPDHCEHRKKEKYGVYCLYGVCSGDCLERRDFLHVHDECHE